MTVWARNDVCAVSISPDHGGCGEAHTRPVVKGAPVKVWALTCHGGCEDHLRGNSLWAGTPEGVPETPDETNIRLDVERRGQLEQQSTMASALNDLAKLGDLPGAIAQLAQIMAGSVPQQLMSQPLLLCRNGHRNTATVKFCGECGADLNDGVGKAPVAEVTAGDDPVTPEAGTQQAEPTSEPKIDLANLDPETTSLATLKEIASQVGAPTARSKAEQISLIQQAQQNQG